MSRIFRVVSLFWFEVVCLESLVFRLFSGSFLLVVGTRCSLGGGGVAHLGFVFWDVASSV